MRIALLIIATGERYRQYAKTLIQSVQKYFDFPCFTFLWTDDEFSLDSEGIGPIPNYGACYSISKKALGFPDETLYRYHTALTIEKQLQFFDYVFQIDADFLAVDLVRPVDIFSDGITATLHPGFLGTAGTPERSERSFAYLSPDKDSVYYCGGFIGGKTPEFLKMARWIKAGVDWDAQLGIKAKFHDESFVNKYLHYAPPAKTLSPSYCYPENYDGRYGWSPNEYKPILVALDKK